MNKTPGILSAADFRMRVSATAEQGILNNLEKNTDSSSHLMVCGELQEVANTFLCITYFQLHMNEAFTKMGFFWGTGRGFEAGTLLENSSPVLANYDKIIAGHNLPGNVIADYFKSVDTVHDSKRALNPAEEEFKSNFAHNDRIAALNNKYFIISVSVQSTKDFRSTLNHEINHAKYYLQPNHKKIVDDFWQNQVTESDRAAIRNVLGAAYNIHNENTMVDEFQAYLLEDDAESDALGAFVGKYRDKLLIELSSRSR